MTLFSGSELACRRGERDVFAALSFALPEGAALLLTGPNGSGKSSLLRLMAGLLPPRAGSLVWAGVAIAGDSPDHRARLHFLGHLDAVKPVLTALETVAFWAGLRGAGADAAADALDAFGLAHLAGLPCRMLSAGQRKRLALARLLAAPAPLWLLDEPTTGLDSASVVVLEAAIAAHRAEGGIVVASTHIPLALSEAQTISLADYKPRRREADFWTEED